jgi:hypothetical protein
MKVKLQDFWLAGAPEDPWKSQASGLRMSSTRQAQVAERIRAAAADVFNRGNLIHAISFDVSRTHVTPQAAELFLLDHPEQIPASGVLTLLTIGPTGAQQTRTYQAVLTGIQSSHNGISSRHSYTLTGKRLS